MEHIFAKEISWCYISLNKAARLSIIGQSDMGFGAWAQAGSLGLNLFILLASPTKGFSFELKLKNSRHFLPKCIWETLELK